MSTASTLLTLYETAITAVLSAQSYTINNRSVTMADLSDLEKGRDKYKKEVAQDPITQFTQQLATSMQPAMQGMMSEVMQLIDQVSSLEELQQLLASAEISTDTAINTLQQGLVASELAGMLSVEDESE